VEPAGHGQGALQAIVAFGAEAGAGGRDRRRRQEMLASLPEMFGEDGRFIHGIQGYLLGRPSGISESAPLQVA
jgi:hypothetical protein